MNKRAASNIFGTALVMAAGAAVAVTMSSSANVRPHHASLDLPAASITVVSASTERDAIPAILVVADVDTVDAAPVEVTASDIASSDTTSSDKTNRALGRGDRQLGQTASDETETVVADLAPDPAPAADRVVSDAPAVAAPAIVVPASASAVATPPVVVAEAVQVAQAVTVVQAPAVLGAVAEEANPAAATELGAASGAMLPEGVDVDPNSDMVELTAASGAIFPAGIDADFSTDTVALTVDDDFDN